MESNLSAVIEKYMESYQGRISVIQNYLQSAENLIYEYSQSTENKIPHELRTASDLLQKANENLQNIVTMLDEDKRLS